MNVQEHAMILWIVAFFAVLVLLVLGAVLVGFFRNQSRIRREIGRPTAPERDILPSPDVPEVPPIPLELRRDTAEAPTQGPAPVLAPTAPTPEEPSAPAEDEFASSRTLSQALEKTEKSFFGRLRGLFQNETATKNFEDIEEILYTSDLGPQTVERLMERLGDLSRSEKSDLAALKSALKEEFLQIFEGAQVPEPKPEETLGHLSQGSVPSVWMIVGVNGAGKTTTIGKVSAHLARQGKRVLVAAGDTFRAAAESQLKVWTDRAQVELFSPEGVKDPSAVAFDAVSKAKTQSFDVVLIDTAGRLHTQANLMEELKKVKRVLAKIMPDAPHETLIVLDANSGQNALQQAREFHQALTLTGVVLTKMDGTAKGGVAVGLAQELKVPIRLIGIGEKIGDLRAFSATEFVDSILGGN